MEWLALSFFFCTVLVLVDRNQVWRQFWHFGKLVGGAILALAVTLGAIYYAYDAYQAKAAAPPVTITPDH